MKYAITIILISTLQVNSSPSDPCCIWRTGLKNVWNTFYTPTQLSYLCCCRQDLRQDTHGLLQGQRVYENRNYYIASFPDISRCTDRSPYKWIVINETYSLIFSILQTQKPQVRWIGLEVGDLTLYKYNFPWNKKGTAYKCWFIILIYFLTIMFLWNMFRNYISF